MLGDEGVLKDLREALAHSPDNVPLRHHLGRMLLRRGHLDEGEAVYREGLKLAPVSDQLKTGLAQACFANDKASEAAVIVEELVASGRAGGDVFLLRTRLCLREGDVDRASRAYHRAVELDPDLADEDLDEMFGSPGEGDDRPFDDPEVDEDGRVRLFEGAPGGPVEAGTDIERPTTTFADVGGMDSVKDEIRMKIIHPLAHPELFEQYGQRVGGGVLLYGPPGCGKTHLARATAGEVDAAFIPIGIHDVLDMYIGQSEQRLHAIFEQARASAPCVLFFDEVDALGASRSDMRQSSGRRLINQFLSELDGVQSSNDGVLVLGATNAPWHLDAAFRRPGRFDRVIFVPPPDEDGRAAILRILLKGRPVDAVDHAALARKAAGLSGADLKAVVEQATQGRLQEAMRSGQPSPITTRDLKSALKSVKPSTKEWFATARNYALYANESGAYDDVLKYLTR